MVLVMCILMSAYFIRGITGFGSALISVPLLALSQPLHFAVPLVLALDFTASVVLGSTNNKKANWSEIKILLPAGMVGACIGAFALLSLPTQPVLLALGVFVILVGFRNVFGLQPEGQLSRAWAIPAGLGGGAAGAARGAAPRRRGAAADRGRDRRASPEPAHGDHAPGRRGLRRGGGV